MNLPDSVPLTAFGLAALAWVLALLADLLIGAALPRLLLAAGCVLAALGALGGCPTAAPARPCCCWATPRWCFSPMPPRSG